MKQCSLQTRRQGKCLCASVFGDEMEDVYLWGCLRTTVCQRNTHTQSSFQHGIFFLSSLIILAESRCMELRCEREGKVSEWTTVFRTRSSSTPWRYSLSFSFAKNMTCHISSAPISPLPLVECGPEQDEIICACAWNKHGPFTNAHRSSFAHPVGLLISLISVAHT